MLFRSRPFSVILGKAQTANYIPFHFDIIGLGADVDVDLGFCGGEVGRWGEMSLLMLFFYCMIGRAAIDIFTIDTNAHTFNSKGKGSFFGVYADLLVFPAKGKRRGMIVVSGNFLPT